MKTTSDNIILTGMPGSGKSTVGVILAKTLCRTFVDTDLLIQTGEGMSLQEIIDRRGMEEFLAIEERYITGLTTRDTVIAPGGSVVLSSRAITYLRESGIVVFLDTPIGLIMARIDVFSRGIVKTPGRSIGDVWREREPLYRKYADIVMDCGTKSQLEIADNLTAMLQNA
ncbi:shikimate kinase [bacterium]|nr:shikimate kinase [bacterium]